ISIRTNCENLFGIGVSDTELAQVMIINCGTTRTPVRLNTIVCRTSTRMETVRFTIRKFGICLIDARGIEMNNVQQKLLRSIEKHDGEWGWYQLDRVVNPRDLP